MKKLLIVYPNWLPSNAVGVQRVRLIVNFLEEFGWEPVIVCVDPAFYEEEVSADLSKIVKKGIRVFPVKAKNANKRFRLYGDIALRAYGNLKKKALENSIPYQNLIQILIHQFATNKIHLNM